MKITKGNINSPLLFCVQSLFVPCIVSDVTVSINTRMKDEKMKTATKVRDLEYRTGPKALYKLSDRLNGFDYVVVSAVLDPYVHETYIFGCDENGHVIDWMELPGSTRDVFDHKTVLNNAGYEVN